MTHPSRRNEATSRPCAPPSLRRGAVTAGRRVADSTALRWLVACVAEVLRRILVPLGHDLGWDVQLARPLLPSRRPGESRSSTESTTAPNAALEASVGSRCAVALLLAAFAL